MKCKSSLYHLCARETPLKMPKINQTITTVLVVFCFTSQVLVLGTGLEK